MFTGVATVTFTDIDPAHDYFGLPSSFQRAGVPFANQLTGPTLCYPDVTKPNYGCIPPVGAQFLGLEGFRVDLPVDIDGNGLFDKILLDVFRHEVEEILQQTSDGSTVTTVFRMGSTLTGAVLDQENDPPFSIFATGVVTGQQSIVVAAVPEPGTCLLCGAALAGLLAAAASAAGDRHLNSSRYGPGTDEPGYALDWGDSLSPGPGVQCSP